MSDGHGRRFSIGKKFKPFSKSKSKSEKVEESEEKEKRRPDLSRSNSQIPVLSRSYSQQQGDQSVNRSSNFTSSDVPRFSTSTQHRDHGDGGPLRRSFTQRRAADHEHGSSSSSALPRSFTQRRGRHEDESFNLEEDLLPQGSTHRRKFPKTEPDNDPLGLRKERRMWQKPLYDLPCLPDPWNDPFGIWKEIGPGRYVIPYPPSSDGSRPRLVDNKESKEWVENSYHLEKNYPELVKQSAQFGPMEDIYYYAPNPRDYPTHEAFLREIHKRLGIEHEFTSLPPEDHCEIPEERCDICFEGHWHRDCPYRNYLPPDAHINHNFCSIVCKCGRHISEQGPCPDWCGEDKFVIDNFTKSLLHESIRSRRNMTED